MFILQPMKRVSQAATGPVPPQARTLNDLARVAQACRNCELYRRATQTVFGEGDPHAPMMLVGEQPGNDEDLIGLPFVGPAGRLLKESLLAAGIPRTDVYLTNTVKHFKWVAMGKRRLHQKPSAREVHACQPWLHAELRVLQPRLVVALGATAAQALMGKAFRVTRQRGEVLVSPWGYPLLATVHPSSILRIPEEEARHAALRQFIEDLHTAHAWVRHAASTPQAAQG
jgi:uracil-DNA glycosylase family protein